MTRDASPYVFHRRGAFIRDFRKSWDKATAQAGCSGRVFHALRRSSARDRIRAGVHERVVMSVNGWKTRSVFERYNITSEKDMEDALVHTERYRHEQWKLQEFQPEATNKLQCAVQSPCHPYGA